MKKRILIQMCFIFLLASTSNAQRWKQYRYDIFAGIGTSNFMGDLGGGASDAAHFLGVRDLDATATRPGFHVGMRYKLLSMVTTKVQFNYAFLNGNDSRSGSFGRYTRNLAFRTPIYELSTQLEYFFLPEKVSSRYQISSGFRNLLSAYVFVGVGAFYFNPKAKGPDNKWYALQPLGTEGQGWVSDYYSYVGSNGTIVGTRSEATDSILVKVKKPYSRVALALPLGIGIKYTLTRYISLGVELSARYTSTDYLDDASGNYFNFEDAVDRNLIPGNKDDYALNTYFADRHYTVVNYDTQEVIAPDESGWSAYPLGRGMRGSASYNDAYMFLNITVYYKLSSTRSGLPKFK